MFFYFVYIIICSSIAFSSQFTKSQWPFWLISIITFALSALRFDVGFDYPEYYKMALGYDKFQYLRIEPLNKLILQIVWLLHEPQIIFVIYSFLILFIISVAIQKESLAPVISLLTYLCFPTFFLDSLSLIRQHAAIAIILFNYSNITNRKVLNYIILAIVAILFHYTAIIALPLYYLSKVNIKPVYLVLCLLLSLLFAPMVMNLIVRLIPFYSNYFTSGERIGEGGSIIAILINILGIIFCVLHKRIVAVSEKNWDYIKFFITGVVLFNFLSQFGHAGLRSFMYYGIFLIYIIPSFIKLFVPVKLAILLTVSGLSFLFLFNIYISTTNPKKSPYIPYKIYFFQDQIHFK